MIVYLFISFLLFLLLNTFQSFAGVEIKRTKHKNLVTYTLLTNNTEYKIIYLPSHKDSPQIMKVLNQNIFSNNPLTYKIKYNDHFNHYEIYINNDLLFSFDKQTAYQIGYSNLQSLINSYNISLSNLKYVPEIFFEKPYIETIVNQTSYVKIYNKTGKSFTLNIPEYCYYQDGKLYINSNSPVFQQTITLNYEGGEDNCIITSKIPSFSLARKNFTIQYNDKHLINKIDLIKSFILPNIQKNNDIEIKFVKDPKGYLVYTDSSSFPYKDIKELVTFNLIPDHQQPKLNFDYLIMSNNPEKINQKGIIFESDIFENSSYWIWFHHSFQTNLNYCIEIQSFQKSNLEIFLDYNKNNSEIDTGIKTATNFYQFLLNKPILKTTLYPNEKMRLIIEKMKPEQVITGFIYLKSSEKLKLNIFSFDKEYPSNFLNQDGTPRSTGKFPKPIVTQIVNFNTSDNFKSIRIPHEEQIISNNIAKNYSNYGVLYKLMFNISNPENKSQKVNIYFSSISGYTPLLFMKNNELYRVESGSYKKILELYLNPYEQKVIPINFVITPGLSYPIEFEISTNNL